MQNAVKRKLLGQGNYVPTPNHLVTLPDVSCEAKVIWIYLLSLPEGEMPGRNQLSEALALHRKVISRAIQEMEKLGMVRLRSGIRGSHEIELLPPDDWGRKCSTAVAGLDTICPTTGALLEQRLGQKVSSSYNSINSGKSKQPKKNAKGAIPELQEFEEQLASVSQELQRRWLMTYQPLEAIQFELRKAINWKLGKGGVTKKWGQFLNNWLSSDYSTVKPAQSKVEPEKLKFNAPNRKRIGL